MIAIDNYIQSPVVATALTTSLDDQFFASQDALYATGISSIFGGDLLKIGDEIMKVNSVGVGSTNIIRVTRDILAQEEQVILLEHLLPRFRVTTILSITL